MTTFRMRSLRKAKRCQSSLLTSQTGDGPALYVMVYAWTNARIPQFVCVRMG